MKKIILGTLGILLFGGFGTFYFVWSQYNNARPSTEIANTDENSKAFYDSFVDENASFAEGERLFRSAQYDKAIEKYTTALETVDEKRQEGQTKYKIALSYIQAGNPAEGISLLKEIANNEEYTRYLRAYAVQNIGSILYTYNTEAIKEEVFKDDPYKKFLSYGDYALARRMIFDMASSLYPLGISELRSAKWFSEEILKIIQNPELYPDQTIIDPMKETIREKIARADAYLLEIVDNPQERGYMGEVLYRKGNVLADMKIAGDDTFPDPEESYKKAIELSVLKKSPEAAAKLRYAIFLAKTNPGRIEEIKKLLEGFQNGVYDDTNTVRSIANEKDGLLGNKEDYLLLARVDDSFAEFLRNLGWEL